MQVYAEADRVSNTNRDGVFKCPRCYKKHYVPTNYDYLCDGCVDILLTHPKTMERTLAGIKYWRSIASDNDNPEITARFEERARLGAECNNNPDAVMVAEPDLIQMIDSMTNYWGIGEEFDI
jgi:hypothetical protein